MRLILFIPPAAVVAVASGGMTLSGLAAPVPAGLVSGGGSLAGSSRATPGVLPSGGLTASGSVTPGGTAPAGSTSGGLTASGSAGATPGVAPSGGLTLSGSVSPGGSSTVVTASGGLIVSGSPRPVPAGLASSGLAGSGLATVFVPVSASGGLTLSGAIAPGRESSASGGLTASGRVVPDAPVVALGGLVASARVIPAGSPRGPLASGGLVASTLAASARVGVGLVGSGGLAGSGSAVVDSGPLVYLPVVLEAELLAYLTGRLAYPVWPGVLPSGYRPNDLPALVYTLVSSEAGRDLDGATGLRMLSVQFDAYATTMLSAAYLIEKLEGVLDGYSGPMGAATCQNATLSSGLHGLDIEPSGSGFPVQRRTAEYWIAFEKARPRFA